VLIWSVQPIPRPNIWPGLNRVKKITLNGRPEREGFNDWLLTAASYNAGPTRGNGEVERFWRFILLGRAVSGRN